MDSLVFKYAQATGTIIQYALAQLRRRSIDTITMNQVHPGHYLAPQQPSSLE
jgi:hypothetical protein